MRFILYFKHGFFAAIDDVHFGMDSKLGWEKGLPHSEPEFVNGNRFLGSLNVYKVGLFWPSLHAWKLLNITHILKCLSHVFCLIS
jgi:hypothetical protein